MRTLSQNHLATDGNPDQGTQASSPDSGKFSPLTGGFIFHLLGFKSQQSAQYTGLEILAAARKYAVLAPKDRIIENLPEPPPAPNPPAPRQPAPKKQSFIANPVRTPPPEQYNPKTMTFVWTRLRPNSKRGNRFR